LDVATEPCLDNLGALGRLAFSGFTQVAVRCMLATGKAVGLGSCCRTGLVNVAQKPCIGRTGGTGTPRLLRDYRRWQFGVCSQRKKMSGWVAVAALESWTLLQNPAWVNWGHLDASPPAGTTQVAVRCVLATGKAVGLGYFCRTGLVHVAPKPCIGRTGGIGTPRLLRDSRRLQFGVCSHRKSCRAG
jgi:hypothetical protein